MTHTLAGLLRNAAFSIMADLLNRVANTLLFILISRSLGVSAAGAFALGITYFFIGSRFSLWGLGQLLTREVARNRHLAGHYLWNFVALRLVLSIVAIVVVTLIVHIIPYGQQTRTVILLVSVGILFENVSEICRSLFMAFERMSYLSLVALGSGTVKLTVGALLLSGGAGVETMALIFTFVSGLTMIANLFLARTRFVQSPWRLDLSFCVSQLQIAFPFVFIGVFFILDNRMDIIVLSILRGEQDVGLYSAAATIVTGLAMAPEGFRTAIYPILARYQAQSAEATRRLYARSFKYLLLLAVPMALGVTLTADEAIHTIYGPAFAPAGSVLRILAWSLLAFCLTVLNGRLLIVNDRQDLMARFLVVSATSNLVLNILLVPTAGAVGSALAKVVSSTMLLLLSQGAAMRLLSGFSPWGFIGRPLIAGIIMGGLVWLLKPWGLVIQIPAGAIAYVGTLLALRTFPRDEQALWQRALLQLRQQEALDE